MAAHLDDMVVDPGPTRPASELADLPFGRWSVAPDASAVVFVARHLMVSRVRGRFTDVSGSIVVADDPFDSCVEAVAQAASLSTGDAARDAHLRSRDFFDVETWPTLSLRGHGLRWTGSTYLLTAYLTIRNVTVPVEFDVSARWAPPARAGGPDRARFVASATVNRKDFDLRWNSAIETGGVVVGDQVELRLDVVGSRIEPGA